ncbi:MAG TPA: hypothetical protein VEL76_42835 [Gemmataceae bacterium]|nr:hypothetical protein [Gemmataceae bacterium]
MRPPDITAIQEGYLKALPKMKKVARFRLRHLDAERKDDAVQEVLAICWEQYRRLFERGRDVQPLVQKIAEFATRRVRCGREWVGTRCRDVLSPVARPDHHVESIPLTEEKRTQLRFLPPCQPRGLGNAGGQAARTRRR